MFDVDPLSDTLNNLTAAKRMPLSEFHPSTIRHAVAFGIDGTAYLDGYVSDRVPNGLHRIRGVYCVDVHNATERSEYRAMETIRSNGFIVV